MSHVTLPERAHIVVNNSVKSIENKCPVSRRKENNGGKKEGLKTTEGDFLM